MFADFERRNATKREEPLQMSQYKTAVRFIHLDWQQVELRKKEK